MIKTIIHALRPIIKWIGKIHFPYSHKLVVEGDFANVNQIVKPGYGIVAHTRGELSNAFINGFWKHGAMLSPLLQAIDLTSDGCAANGLINFLMHKDYFILIRCRLLDDYQHYLAARAASMCVGKIAYDFDFDLNDSLKAMEDKALERPSLYCFEALFYWWSFVRGKPIFTPRERGGIFYINGDDFIFRPELFEIVYLSRSLALR